MKVYVVMGNDYPDSAFSSEEGADNRIVLKIAEDKKNTLRRTRIHWRWYEFELQP